MKETKKGSRLFGIALVVSNFLYLFCRGARIIMHQQMMLSDHIQEATLQKLMFLDHIAGIMKFVLALVAFLAILYLIEELFHSTLSKDCSVLCVSMLVCLLLSLTTILFLKQPLTFLQEHLDFIPYFFTALALITLVNQIKIRLVHQVSRI